MNPLPKISSKSDRISVCVWLMRFIVLLQGIGVWGRYISSPNEVESDVYGLLYFDLGWPERLALLIDDSGAYACLISGITILLAGMAARVSSQGGTPSAVKRLATGFQLIASVIVASWMLTIAVTHMIRGDLYTELSLGEHAVRFALPIGLILMLLERPFAHRVCLLLLKIATALTFAVHGYKAIQLYGPFIDLIIFTDLRLLKIGLEQSFVEPMLVTIGVVDIVLAGLLFVTRWRWVLVYLTAWGFITAASRMTAGGWNSWPEVLIRTANGGTPLLLLLWLEVQTKSKDET